MTDKDRLEWTLDEIDVTDNNDLRELVEEWRVSANDMDYAGQSDYGRGRVKVFRDCADELEELIE